MSNYNKLFFGLKKYIRSRITELNNLSKNMRKLCIVLHTNHKDNLKLQGIFSMECYNVEKKRS